MVGLLWKRIIKGDREEWIFQCRVNESNNNGLNSLVFWGSMIFMMLSCIVFMTLNALTFNLFRVVILFIPFFLSFVNFSSFLACSKGKSSFYCFLRRN